jgi:hypothetical protein
MKTNRTNRTTTDERIQEQKEELAALLRTAAFLIAKAKADLDNDCLTVENFEDLQRAATECTIANEDFWHLANLYKGSIQRNRANLKKKVAPHNIYLLPPRTKPDPKTLGTISDIPEVGGDEMNGKPL